MKLLAKMLLLVAEKFKDTPDRQGLPFYWIIRKSNTRLIKLNNII